MRTFILVLSAVFTTAQAASESPLAPLPDATAAAEPAAVADRQADSIATVTVSARRRAEPSQNVPASLSVISGDALDAHNVYLLQDLQQYLPNLNAQFLHARQSSVAVRGIGNNLANDGLEASVGLYIDNVFLGRPGQAVFDLFDIEQIELLRGPQGTLFGKNTSAGVLNVTTRGPTFDTERSAEVSFGQRNYRQLKATLSGPFSQRLAYRVNAYRTTDDGWLLNLYDGRLLDATDRKGVRAQLLFRADEALSLRLIGEHHAEDSSTGSLVPYGYAPLNRGAGSNTPLGTPGSNATTFASWVARLGEQHVITDAYRYQTSLDGPQRQQIDQDAASAQLDWKFAGYQLTSISAWRNWHFSPHNDVDGSSLPGFSDGGFAVAEVQRSQELRLASPLSAHVDYVLGLYYLQQEVGSDNTFRFGRLALALTGNPNNSSLSGHGQADTRSSAGFMQGNVHLPAATDLTVGWRSTHERKDGRVLQNAIVPALPVTVSPFFNNWDSGAMHSIDNNNAYLLTLSRHVDASLMAYATLSSGAKSGGYNINSVASVGAVLGTQALFVGPEKAHNAELGFKANWLDNRLLLDMNLFVTKVADYQATAMHQLGSAYIVTLDNVGDLTSRGLEFDLKVAPARGWRLGLNGALTDARFDRGMAPTPFELFHDGGNNASSGYGKGVRSIAGLRVNGAPRVLLNASVQWQWRANAGQLYYFNGNAALRSDSYADVNNSALSRLPGYGLFNVSAGSQYRQGGQQVDVTLWIKNLSDKHYFPALASFNNTYYGAAAPPRTVGMSLRFAL